MDPFQASEWILSSCFVPRHSPFVSFPCPELLNLRIPSILRKLNASGLRLHIRVLHSARRLGRLTALVGIKMYRNSLTGEALPAADYNTRQDNDTRSRTWLFSVGSLPSQLGALTLIGSLKLYTNVRKIQHGV